MKVEEILREKEDLLKTQNMLYEKVFNKLEELKLTIEVFKNKLEDNNNQIEKLNTEIKLTKQENINCIQISENLRSQIVEVRDKNSRVSKEYMKYEPNIEVDICTEKNSCKEENKNNVVEFNWINSNINDTSIWSELEIKNDKCIYEDILNNFNSDNFEKARLNYNRIIFKREAIKSLKKYQNITLLFIGYIINIRVHKDNIKEYTFIQNNFNLGQCIEIDLYERLSGGMNVSKYIEKYKIHMKNFDPKAKNKILNEIKYLRAKLRGKG